MVGQPNGSIFTYNLEKFDGHFSGIKKNLIDTSLDTWLPNIELKSDALAKLMNMSSLHYIQQQGEHEWDKIYVRSTYENAVDKIKFIYYPSANPRKLIINFSSMGKDRYDRYSRHWDSTQKWESDAAYLFFKDDDFKYFLGDDKKPLSGSYRRIIKQFLSMNSLTNENAFTVGGSMGGYAALYYAITMNLKGAIVAAPQINLRSMQAHKYDNWLRCAISTGTQWRDLDMLLHTSSTTPFMYIEHGGYAADNLAIEPLIHECIKRNSLLLIRRAGWVEHTVDSVLSKDIINNTITYFEAHHIARNNY